MPELPEVEVVRRRLRSALVGRVITRVRTGPPSPFFLTSPAVLRRRLQGRTPTALHRHGKYLIVPLDDGSRMVWHFGMTGQLLTSTERALDVHTHLALFFADGDPAVLFRDARKFGRCALLEPGEKSERLDRLGPDALRASAETLFHAARRRRIPLKALLLNQSVLAGVGNIYADETLYVAGFRPTRKARRLTLEDWHALTRALRTVLRRSIRSGGTTISDYVQPDGRPGAFQNQHRVYARQGLPCAACGTLIRRVVIAQRSAHYCPVCQR
ncbi:MAG TPA: bifunctional DNA-formamidopyrimidine glycosylase/DNA-(apurinic or apyrimidinic site) lyase [Polyangiaceae bacterium]